MKKTININLNGINFILDEDAFKDLDNYLGDIRKHFKGKNGGDEIISDIEARLAELLKEKLNGEKEVINIEDISSIKKQFGSPSDFEESSDEDTVYTARPQSRRKRLYRDPFNRIIGGVCSGLGAYFHTDPTWVRILFVAAIFVGVSPVIYLILWVIMPAAHSVNERLEMKGEPLNFSNIEKTIKEEFEGIRDTVDDFAGKAREKFSRKKDSKV